LSCHEKPRALEGRLQRKKAGLRARATEGKELGGTWSFQKAIKGALKRKGGKEVRNPEFLNGNLRSMRVK